MTQLKAVGRSAPRAITSASPSLRVLRAPLSAAPIEPVRASPSAGAPARVHAFFQDVLPRVAHQRADLFDLVRGSLSLFVEGAGSWCVRFGDHRAADAIDGDASFDSDAVVVFTVPAFIALLDGGSGAAPTVALGDTKLIARLGELLLEPARGALGARLYSATKK